MMKEEKPKQSRMLCVFMEDLVPKGHFLRKLEQEICVNIAYRWFLGLDLEDRVPDHSVFSQNRRRRFKDTEVFREILRIRSVITL